MGALLSQCWLVFLLDGMVASTCGGVWGRVSVDCFDRWILPDSCALGAGLPGLLGSCSIELLPPSRSGGVQLPLPLLFFTPFASPVFLETSASWVSTVSSALDSERAFPFGSFFLLGIHLRPRLLLP